MITTGHGISAELEERKVKVRDTRELRNDWGHGARGSEMDRQEADFGQWNKGD